MTNGRRVRLGDIAEFVNGVAFKPEDWGEIGQRIIRIQNLSDPTKPYNQTTRVVADKYHVQPGDLLVSWSATLGVFVWDEPDVGLVNQHIFRVIPDANRVVGGYLRHMLSDALIEMERHLHGATMKHVNRREFLSTEIPLPPLAEQKRIAGILDAADTLRAKRRESLAQLDALLQSTFLDMFGDPVTNPKEWEKERMGNIMRIRRGGSPRPIDKYLGGTINWVKIGDATRSTDDLYISSCAERISSEGLSKTTLLEPGSLVFANSGVSLGFARILKVQGAIHDGWLAFDDYDGERLDQIFFLKTLNALTEHFRRIAPSGTQPNLNTGIMRAFELILPPIREQRCFASIVKSVERQKARMRAHLAELDTLLASLQSRAFSGAL